MLNFKNNFVELCLNNAWLNRTISMGEKATGKDMTHYGNLNTICRVQCGMEHIQHCVRVNTSFCFCKKKILQVTLMSTNINFYNKQ